MKKFKFNSHYLKFLFWLGPILVVAGLSAGVVSGTWGSVPLGMIIAGIVVIGLWLLLQSSPGSGFWSRRSTQASTNALVSTLAVIVILGLINFLGVRHTKRIDLSENQQFSLAPQTQQVVQNLQQPVKAWVFTKQADPAVRSLLEEYQRQGKLFSFEFVDPQAQPGLAQAFSVKDLGDVYLELGAGKRRQFIQSLQTERFSEVKLTNGIEQLTRDRPTKVYFLQGHGERPVEAARDSVSQTIKSLKDKNATSEPLNLAQNPEVPKDANVVVVAGPKRSLLEAEVKALRNYLQQGGSLLLMLDPNTSSGLDGLLQDWGVKLDNRLAVDASGSGQAVGLGPAVPIVTQYGDHPITKSFANGISFYPLARPIDLTPVAGVQEIPLIFTDERSWAESNLTSKELQFDSESDRKGPLILGVALSRETKAATTSPAATAAPATQPSPATPSSSPEASPPNPSPSPTASPAGATPAPSASPTTTSEKLGPPLPATAQATPAPSATPAATSEKLGPPLPAATQATSAPGASPTVSPTGTPPSPSPQTSPSPAASPSPGTSPAPGTSPSPGATAAAQSNSKPTESRLVVLGDSDFATDSLFGQQLNGDVLLNSVSWLSKQDEQILSIRPKEPKNRRIDLTPLQARLTGWIALGVLPLLGFGAAGILWWRRR
jgi:ABC-type uncharacterized transport system involved in gliding motility auxiliary subunit